MRIHAKTWICSFGVLLALESALFGAFLATRPPLSREQWFFLERQRPHIVSTPGGSVASFDVCADCLDFALARRALGGWESGIGRVLETANVPPVLAARASFRSLQERSGGTSRGNSDVATVVFAVAVLVECGIIAGLVSLRERRMV